MHWIRQDIISQRTLSISWCTIDLAWIVFFPSATPWVFNMSIYTWLSSEETCMQVRKQQLELDMEQQTGSK